MNRVAVTGLGALCGLGKSTKEVWSNALEGKSGISNIEQLDTTDLAVKFAGEVKDFQLNESILPEKEARRYDRFIHFALHSSAEAYDDAGIANAGYDMDKVGAILGVGMGGFPEIERSHTTFTERGPRRVSPFFIPSIIPNLTTGLLSIRYGFQGLNYSIASACASANHALSAAFYEIQSGRHDVMISGGAESVICNLPIAGFSNMKALSKRNDEPEKASRPFDTGRDGFVMGEGAGVLILENYDKAKARGAKIYAELAGVGASSDAYHITAPHPEGTGAIKCMKQALDLYNIPREEVDYINAHGTSTPLGDKAETEAIKKVFGDQAFKLNVSSTKSMTGHLLGAAGGLESVFSVKALETGIVPPTINIDEQDPECDLNCTPNQAQKREIRYALNNSFGFGATNSTVIFKQHE